MLRAALDGYGIGLSLILAIGAQNAFVLRQGLRREHVGAVVLLCAGSDALLIMLGVWGFGSVAKVLPLFKDIMLWLGVAFLVSYGFLRFRAAWQGGQAMVIEQGAGASLASVTTMCLLFTWANPHVYLDTVVFMGSISAQYAPFGAAFAVGAMAASFSFFTALGYGSRYLAPIFAKPLAWQGLEVIIGIMMWVLAVKLLYSA